MQAATKQELDLGFVCAECNDQYNPCFYDGVCEPSAGVCTCSDGSKGSLCENPPVGNGRCDPYFNKLEFNMDGGDCCRATCKSSPEYTCGKDDTGFLDTGFFFCESSDPLMTDTIIGEPLAEVGRHVAISSNGYLLATSIKKHSIAIYDKKGAEWNERIVLKVCPTAVQAMDITSGPFVSNPFLTEPPFILTVSCEGSSQPVLYYCRAGEECLSFWLDKPEEADGTFGSQLAISTNGGVVAASSLGDERGSSLVCIFRASSKSGSGSVEWNAISNETIIPMKYQQDNPLNGTLTVRLDPGLNITLTRNVTLQVEPKPQYISSTSLSNVDSIVIAARDNVDSFLNQIHYYQWNGSIWEEHGIPLEIMRCPDFSEENMIRLSDDGKVLLVSDGRKVSVYKWDEDSSKWEPRGTPFELSECTIKNIVLSAAGSELAVNAVVDDGVEVHSRVLTFNLSDNEWERRERRDDTIQFKGDSPLTLAMSYHGRELAIGRPNFPADLSGRLQTFEFPRSQCEAGHVRFRITTTIHSTATKWNLVSLTYNNTFVTSSGGPYYFPDFPGAADVAAAHHNGATIVEEVCVPEHRCSNFTLYPSGFGGTALMVNQETQFIAQNVDVYSMLISAVNQSACDLADFERKRLRSFVMINDTLSDDANSTDGKDTGYDDDDDGFGLGSEFAGNWTH
jgi:hypothetical protein